MKTYEIYQSAEKEKNEARYGIDSNSCVCCGKRIKNIEYMINTTTDWVCVDEPNEDNIHNSQGSFPVGSECRKHFPKEFIFKVN